MKAIKESYEKHYPQRICKHCGKLYQPKRKIGKLCSKRCMRRQWRVDHSKRYRELQKKYKQKHKIKYSKRIKDYMIVWRKNNKEKMRSSRRFWQRNNPEKVKQYDAAKYRKHKKVRQLRQKAYYKKNKKRILERCRQYALKNNHLKREWSRRRTASKLMVNVGDKAALKTFFKWAYETKIIPCYYCKIETTKKTRHIDHKTPLIRKGPHEANNLCVACASCNLEKHTKTEQEYFEYKANNKTS